MGLFSLKHSVCREQMEANITLTSAEKSAIVGWSQYNPNVPDFTAPGDHTDMRLFYLDKTVVGPGIRIPGETLGRVYAAEASLRQMINSAVVLVPLNERAYSMAQVSVEPYTNKMQTTEDPLVFARQAVVEAINAVCAGRYTELSFAPDTTATLSVPG